MVKLSGPLQSLEASGTLAGSITFNKHARGTTLRKKPQPKHPMTGPQVASQAALTWVTRAWSTLTAVEKATWAHTDFHVDQTPYMAFVAYNTARIRDLKGPSKAYPPTQTGTLVAFLTLVPTCKVRHSDIIYTGFINIYNNWGLLFFRNSPGTTPFKFDNLIAVLTLTDLNPHTYRDTPLATIQYNWGASRFTDDGNHDTTIAAHSGPCTPT